MRSLFFVVCVLFLLGGSFVLLGFCTPENFHTEYSRDFSCSKANVWSFLTDVEAYPNIHEEVESVEYPDPANQNTWVIYDKLGNEKIVRLIEEEPGRKLVVEIQDKSLSITRKKTYLLFGDEDNSMLKVIEESTIEPLLLRSTMAISGARQGLKREVNNFAAYLKKAS